MIVNPTDVAAQYASLDVRSSRVAGPTGNDAPEESSSSAVAGNSDPAVTTTISNAALETARAAQPPDRTTEQNRANSERQVEEVAQERGEEDRGHQRLDVVA